MGRHSRVRCRQRIISTAIVYLARFYYNNSFRDFHPHLIAATSLLLAAKVEECHFPGLAKAIADALRELNRDLPYTIHDIIDGEYFLMEELKFQLVVFHPYRPMQLYIQDIKIEKGCPDSDGPAAGAGSKRSAPDGTGAGAAGAGAGYPLWGFPGDGGDGGRRAAGGGGGFGAEAGGEGEGAGGAEEVAQKMAGVTETAWCLINDSFRLDACLFYPPHIIAIAAVNIACAYMGVDATGWFDSLHFLPAHREQVKQVEDELLVLYEEYSHLKPDEICRVLSKVPIHGPVQQHVICPPPPGEVRPPPP